MKLVILLLSLASPLLAATWPLDDVADTMIVRGTAETAAGASRQSLVLDGESLIELKDSAQLGSGAFTLSLWFNPYDPAGGQQMLAGKNRYSRNEREWSLTIEPDGRLRAYLHQGGWRTISCEEPVKAGAWHFVTLAVGADKAVLFLNGKTVGETTLKTPIAATEAPITLGGIWDAESVRQAFHGALDEFSYQPGFLSAEEIEASYRPVLTTHEIPQLAAGLPLWDAAHPMPKAAELPQVAGAEFYVIKNQRPDTDQCKFTLGVGLAWHKEKLYASYGYNKGHENTPTEEAHVKVSDDGGKTWRPTVVMDAGEGDLAVSHGVFLSHGGSLWAFMGAFYAHEKLYHRVHARAYKLNETTGAWEPRGAIVDGGFWPMQEPQKMSDGNWIMAGFRIGGQFGEAGNLPAVAISEGDDFTKWDLVVIPAAPGLGNIWGESTVIVEDKRILNISRYGKKALALLSVSEDQGRTWTPAKRSNLPMATSKPYAGTLSTGQRYLVCTTTADTGGARSPLTIAVGKPGESLFSQVFLIRHSVCDKTPGISDPKADFSYPYAVEHEGKLYIGYTHKSHAANELAVIPVASLSVTAEASPGASLESRGLPRILFNNDSDDLKWPAYPEHHASVWVPEGKPIPLPAIRSPEDYLALRIGPLAKAGATGLAYCGNFGLPIWELKRDHIAALGDDPLQPILQFWKRDGRTFFFSMRMNDKHHTTFNWAHLWDEFRRTHRHWFLQPPSDAEWKNDFLPWLNDPTQPGPQEMWARVKTQPEELRAGPDRERNGEKLLYDYSKAEVRSHCFAILREACRRYDLDGVELDWLRYPKFFRDGDVNAAVLTEFVREARSILDEAAKRRGHPLRLVTRVPDSPARAKELGLNVEAWLKAGWIDAVIAGNGFTFGSNALDQWVTLAHRHRVPVYGVIERMPRGFARYGTPETLRAAAATLWARGADGLYTFNFYNTAEYPLLAELSDPAGLAHLPKEFFVDACSVTNNATVSEPPLPLNLKPSTPATTRLFIADDPAVARETSLEIVFKGEGETEAPAIALNGQPLHEVKSTRGKSDLTLTLASPDLKQSLKRGTNDFTFTSAASVTVTALSVSVVP